MTGLHLISAGRKRPTALSATRRRAARADLFLLRLPRRARIVRWLFLRVRLLEAVDGLGLHHRRERRSRDDAERHGLLARQIGAVLHPIAAEPANDVVVGVRVDELHGLERLPVHATAGEVV